MRRSKWIELIAVGAAAGISGAGTYVLLIVVARNLPAVDYAEFAAFWAVIVTLGLGAFLPLEQETAREAAGPGGRTRLLLHTSAVVSSILVAIAVAVSAIVIAVRPDGTNATMAIALVLTLMAYGVQFPVRGLLSGARQSSAYAAVVGLEGVLRIALPLVIVMLGVASVLGFGIAVALASLVAVAGAFAARSVVPFRARSDVGIPVFSSRLLRLMIAAFALQLLLNSTVLLAPVLAPDHPELAGQLLAALSLARIPVFVYQVAQVLYIPRIAQAVSNGDPARGLRLIGVAGLLAVLAAAATVLTLWMAGGAIIATLFGSDLVLDGRSLLMVAVGAGIFLVALVLSDGSVGLRMHGWVTTSWVAAVLIGAVTAIVVPDPVVRVTAPLAAGAATALVLLAGGLAIRTRAIRRGLAG